MGKILVLAEKPSVGKELARVLGSTQSRDGHIVGPKYIITWALGHLVTLADPDHYDDKYKKWALETLPMIPKKMDLVVIKQTSKQYATVKALLKNPEIDELVIATDAGREGELVARWIIQKAGFKKPIKRLWISSQTDKAIKEGFSALKPGKDYENLFQSALSRAEADWLVGLNVTRALTCKYNAQLSAGRVQTPTLAMIVQRENEIRAFVPREFYNIVALLNGFQVTWKDRKTSNGRIFEKTRADEIIKKCSGQSCTIKDVKKELKREPSPLLYDLTELQRDANKRYGFSAKDTLNHMQKLYEQHKLLTYPRTDSRHLTTDILPTLKDRLKSISIGAYSPFAAAILRSPIVSNKRFVDDAKVSDHHAIIPTEQFVDLSRLSPDERRVYDLVVKRFLAVLSPDFVYEKTTVSADIAGELFTASGKIIQSKGWKSIYDTAGADVSDDEGLDEESSEEREQSLPNINKGDSFQVKNLKANTGKTSPPARYTEATLLSAMEHPGKFIENAEMRGIMDNTKGIGTPATRADIIEKLFNTNYIERRGKYIFPLSKGEQLIAIVPEDLKSPELTANWEQKLALISKGTVKSAIFDQEIRNYATKIVSNVIASNAAYKHDNLSKTRCPHCDKFLLEINGKKGKMLVCPDRECGYKQNESFTSNARCPKCKKNLEVTGDGEKKLYACKCGFREKYDTFNKRLAENRSNLSKNDVQKYMSSQKSEEPLSSAFADAWAKANKSNP